MIILLLRTICTFIANDIRICLRLCKAFLIWLWQKPEAAICYVVYYTY